MKDKDIPAFPQSFVNPILEISGITIRDYFAAKAMPHALARETDSNGTTFISLAAQNAYAIADAMLEARK